MARGMGVPPHSTSVSCASSRATRSPVACVYVPGCNVYAPRLHTFTLPVCVLVRHHVPGKGRWLAGLAGWLPGWLLLLLLPRRMYKSVTTRAARWARKLQIRALEGCHSPGEPLPDHAPRLTPRGLEWASDGRCTRGVKYDASSSLLTLNFRTFIAGSGLPHCSDWLLKARTHSA